MSQQSGWTFLKLSCFSAAECLRIHHVFERSALTTGARPLWTWVTLRGGDVKLQLVIGWDSVHTSHARAKTVIAVRLFWRMRGGFPGDTLWLTPMGMRVFHRHTRTHIILFRSLRPMPPHAAKRVLTRTNLQCCMNKVASTSVSKELSHNDQTATVNQALIESSYPPQYSTYGESRNSQKVVKSLYKLSCFSVYTLIKALSWWQALACAILQSKIHRSEQKGANFSVSCQRVHEILWAGSCSTEVGRIG